MYVGSWSGSRIDVTHHTATKPHVHQSAFCMDESAGKPPPHGSGVMALSAVEPMASTMACSGKLRSANIRAHQLPQNRPGHRQAFPSVPHPPYRWKNYAAVCRHAVFGAWDLGWHAHSGHGCDRNLVSYFGGVSFSARLDG